MIASSIGKNTLSFIQKLGQSYNVHVALIALLFTTLFFLPFFFDPGSAGFIYSGDIYHSWMPQIMKSSSLIRQGVFSALDYSTQSGASEFFLRSNMIIYHPLLIIASFIKSLSTTSYVSGFLVVTFYLHFLIGCFFAIKVMREMFNFNFVTSVFAAVFYIFSLYMERDIGFPPFVFIATLFPAIIYGGYISYKYQNFFVSFLCSLPIFVSFPGGYIAISVACVAFAAVFLLIWALAIRRVEKPIVSLFYIYLPFAIATLFAAPYYLAVFANYKYTPPAGGFANVFAAAHQLAENPRTVIRGISEGMVMKGPLYEQCIHIGVLPLTILVLSFANAWMFKEEDNVTRRSVLANALIYIFFILIMFGTFSVFSDMFFYLVPGIGNMHIYQRFLLFAHFFLGIVCAYFLQMFARHENDKPPSGRGKTVAFLFIALIASTLFLNLQPDGRFNDGKNVVITDYLVFELIVASFALALWHLTNSVKVFTILATIAIFIPAADRAYDFESTTGYDKGIQGTKHMEMNLDYFDSLGRFFSQDMGKDVVRLYNAEPGVTEAFTSLNLPFYLLPRANVSDYQGYDFNLAQPIEYRNQFPVFVNKQNLLEFKINREWLEYTNLDFVLYKNNQLKDTPLLANIIDLSNPRWVLPVTPDITIAPTVWRMKRLAAGLVNPAIDNGYFRIESADPQAKMTSFKTNKANYFNIEMTSNKPATLHYLFWKNKHLRFYVDGKRVEPNIKEDKYVSVDVPEGTHKVKVCYRNTMTNIFLGGYLLYTLLMAAAFPLFVLRRGRTLKLFKWEFAVP